MTDPNANNPNGPGAATQSESERERVDRATAALRELLASHQTSADAKCLDFCPICRAADVLRATSTPELREQWQVVQREALLTLKTVVDRQVERLDHEPADSGAAVEDIPID
ncbi:MAG: hypothetical protein M3383_03330 [Actinomycetota bacterium]|nr:hypothetical protein [Actinomycetota bacterium]